MLIADPDRAEGMMLMRACREVHLADIIEFVSDVEELADYLHHEGRFADRSFLPRPDLILIDVQAFGEAGLETLVAIKADPELNHVPVMLLSDSRRGDEISLGDGLDVNGVVVKPASFELWIEILIDLKTSWLEVADASQAVRPWWVIRAE